MDDTIYQPLMKFFNSHQSIFYIFGEQGKSAVISECILQLDSHTQVIQLNCHDQMHAKNITDKILDRLEADGANNTLKESLSALRCQLSHIGKALIIVNDAQTLSNESLAFLTHVVYDLLTHTECQMIIAASGNIKSRLEAMQLYPHHTFEVNDRLTDEQQKITLEKFTTLFPALKMSDQEKNQVLSQSNRYLGALQDDLKNWLYYALCESTPFANNTQAIKHKTPQQRSYNPSSLLAERLATNQKLKRQFILREHQVKIIASSCLIFISAVFWFAQKKQAPQINVATLSKPVATQALSSKPHQHMVQSLSAIESTLSHTNASAPTLPDVASVVTHPPSVNNSNTEKKLAPSAAIQQSELLDRSKTVHTSSSIPTLAPPPLQPIEHAQHPIALPSTTSLSNTTLSHSHNIQNKIMIQIFASHSRQKIALLQKQLPKEYGSHITIKNNSEPPVYILQAGPFASKSSATHYLTLAPSTIQSLHPWIHVT